MKKLFLGAVFSALLLTGANAQTKPKGIFLHDPEIMKELNLNAEQQAKILEIRKITDPQIRAARANTSSSPEEMKQELAKIYKDRTKMQNEVLTPEQIEKLKQMRAEAKKEN